MLTRRKPDSRRSISRCKPNGPSAARKWPLLDRDARASDVSGEPLAQAADIVYHFGLQSVYRHRRTSTHEAAKPIKRSEAGVGQANFEAPPKMVCMHISSSGPTDLGQQRKRIDIAVLCAT